MASPTVQSITPSTFGTDATAHLVSMPATVDAGDLLLMLFTADGAPTITTPSGWSIVAAKTDRTSAVCAVIYGKDAAGTEGGTTVDVVTSASEQAAAQVYRITGWGGTLSTDVVAGTPVTAVSADPNPPSVSWTWGTVDVLVIASEHHSANDNASAGPTNYTNLTTTNTATGFAGAAIGSARRAMTAASSPENPAAFTLASNDHIANTVAVKGQVDTTTPRRITVVRQATQRSAVR